MSAPTSVWPGWMRNDHGADPMRPPTWEQWLTLFQQSMRASSQDGAVERYGRREIAARAFLIWFDDAAVGRVDMPFDDRELAARQFMRDFEVVDATFSSHRGKSRVG